jgi:hypothetical protein
VSNVVEGQMNALARTAAAAFAFAVASGVVATDQTAAFADAPGGFEWYVFEAGKSACLRPLDWFVKTEVNGDTAALFLSKENIDKEGKFETGLTLNVARRIHERTGRSPTQYAQAYLDVLVEKHPDAKRFENPDQDGMKGIGAAYLDEEASPAVVIYTFLLSDDESDILRIFILESPQKDWPEVWARGQQMLNCRIQH